MKRKIISLFLLFLLITTLIPAAAFAGTETDILSGTLGAYYSYELDLKTGVLTLDCIENAEVPYMSLVESELRNSELVQRERSIKKIVMKERFSPIRNSNFPFEYFGFCEMYSVEESNQYYSSIDGVLLSKDKTVLHSYPMRKTGTEYTIPDTIKQIGTDCNQSPFEYVMYLQQVTIPKSVETIYDRSFVNTGIGDGNSITEFIVDGENPYYKAVDGVLFSKDGKTLVNYPSAKEENVYVIPGEVETIGSRAFCLTRKLHNVIISEGVKTIGTEAFYCMWGYNGVINIPASVTSIGEKAFAYLNSVNRVDNVTFTRGTALLEFPASSFTNCGAITINYPCDSNWSIDNQDNNFTFVKVHEIDSEWKVTKEATCTEDGEKEASCKLCTGPVKEIIPSPGHCWSDWSVVNEPTSENPGMIKRICGKCSITEEADLPTGAVLLNEKYFPDKVFRLYLKNNCDINKDEIFTTEERAAVNAIIISNDNIDQYGGIESLKGIEYLTELKTLYCDNTKVKEADLSSNTKLEQISFKWTPMTKITLGTNSNLFYLHIDNSQVSEIDVSGLPALRYLNLTGTNISQLNVTKNIALKSLFVSYTNIETLDISKNVNLEIFACTNTKLKELDLSNLPELDWMYASDDNLISLQLSREYDASDFYDKYPEGMDEGDPNVLICYENQNINTIPGNVTSFDLKQWAPNISADSISNLKGAKINGTILTDMTPGVNITYTYDCGAGFTMEVTIGVSRQDNNSSGGAPFPVESVQKPTISTGDGFTVNLGSNGTTASIMVEEGYEILDVQVNGVSKGVVSVLFNLKTGDKVVVTVKKKVEQDPLTIEKLKAELAKVTTDNLKARSKTVTMKNGKKAILLTWKNMSDVDFDGVEIYRSTKRYSGFGKKPLYTTTKEKYYNTAIKDGTKYYYKVRGYVEVDGVKYYSGWSAKAMRTV